jgi:DNA polymerase (family 10)
MKLLLMLVPSTMLVIELNAHPRRLDIDWRYIAEAISKNVVISINPDAHAIDGFEMIANSV